jgi:hypothetical protein
MLRLACLGLLLHAASAAEPTPAATLKQQDCVVTLGSSWGWCTGTNCNIDTSSCSAACTGGIQVKERKVTLRAENGGKACPGWEYVPGIALPGVQYVKTGTPDENGHTCIGNYQSATCTPDERECPPSIAGGKTCDPTPAPTPAPTPYKCPAQSYAQPSPATSFNDCKCFSGLVQNFATELCDTMAPTPAPTPLGEGQAAPVCSADQYWKPLTPISVDADAEMAQWQEMAAVAANASRAGPMAQVSRWFSTDPLCLTAQRNCYPNIVATAVDGSYVYASAEAAPAGTIVRLTKATMALAPPTAALGKAEHAEALAQDSVYVYAGTMTEPAKLYRVAKATMAPSPGVLTLPAGRGYLGRMFVDELAGFLYAVGRTSTGLVANVVLRVDLKKWSTFGPTEGGAASDAVRALELDAGALSAFLPNAAGMGLINSLLESDELYLYGVGGATNQATQVRTTRVVKISKATMAVVAAVEFKDLQRVSTIASDGTHLYLGTAGAQMAKLDKATLSRAATSSIALAGVTMTADGTFAYVTSAGNLNNDLRAKITKVRLADLGTEHTLTLDAYGVVTSCADAANVYLGLVTAAGQVVKVKTWGEYRWAKLGKSYGGAPCRRERPVRCTDYSGLCELPQSDCMGLAPLATQSCSVRDCNLECKVAKKRQGCVTDDTCGPCLPGYESPDFIGNAECTPASKSDVGMPQAANGDGRSAADYCGYYEAVCAPQAGSPTTWETVNVAVGADGSFVRTTRLFRDAVCSSAVGVAVVDKGSLDVTDGETTDRTLFALSLNGGQMTYGRIALRHQIGLSPQNRPDLPKGPFGAMCMSEPTFTKDKAGDTLAPSHCVKRTVACPMRLGKDCGTYQRPAPVAAVVGQDQGCKANVAGGGSYEETFAINADDTFTRTVEEYSDAACGAGAQYRTYVMAGNFSATGVSTATGPAPAYAIAPVWKVRLDYSSYKVTPLTLEAFPKLCKCYTPTWDARLGATKTETLLWKLGEPLDIVQCSIDPGNDCTMHDEHPEVMAQRFVATDKTTQGFKAQNWTSYGYATLGLKPTYAKTSPYALSTSALKTPYMCFSAWSRSAATVSLPPALAAPPQPEMCLVKVATPCKLRKSYKIIGREIIKIPSDSENDCCALCSGNAACVAWNYRVTPEFVDGSVYCQLLSSVESQGAASSVYVAAEFEDTCREPIYSAAKDAADKAKAEKEAAEKAALGKKYPWRGDQRCGRFFAGEDGTYPAQCQGSTSWKACCSPSGYCGTGGAFCDCPDCIDYKPPAAVSYTSECAPTINGDQADMAKYPSGCPRFMCGAGSTEVNGDYYASVRYGADLLKDIIGLKDEKGKIVTTADGSPKDTPDGSPDFCPRATNDDPTACGPPQIPEAKSSLPPTPYWTHSFNSTATIVIRRDPTSGFWFILDATANPRRVFYVSKDSNSISVPAGENKWEVGPYGRAPAPVFNKLFTTGQASLRNSLRCPGVWNVAGNGNDFGECKADLVCLSPSQEAVVPAFCKNLPKPPVFAPCYEPSEAYANVVTIGFALRGDFADSAVAMAALASNKAAVDAAIADAASVGAFVLQASVDQSTVVPYTGLTSNSTALDRVYCGSPGADCRPGVNLQVAITVAGTDEGGTALRTAALMKRVVEAGFTSDAQTALAAIFQLAGTENVALSSFGAGKATKKAFDLAEQQKQNAVDKLQDPLWCKAYGSWQGTYGADQLGVKVDAESVSFTAVTTVAEQPAKVTRLDCSIISIMSAGTLFGSGATRLDMRCGRSSCGLCVNFQLKYGSDGRMTNTISSIGACVDSTKRDYELCDGVGGRPKYPFLPADATVAFSGPFSPAGSQIACPVSDFGDLGKGAGGGSGGGGAIAGGVIGGLLALGGAFYAWRERNHMQSHSWKRGGQKLPAQSKNAGKNPLQSTGISMRNLNFPKMGSSRNVMAGAAESKVPAGAAGTMQAGAPVNDGPAALAAQDHSNPMHQEPVEDFF